MKWILPSSLILLLVVHNSVAYEVETHAAIASMDVASSSSNVWNCLPFRVGDCDSWTHE